MAEEEKEKKEKKGGKTLLIAIIGILVVLIIAVVVGVILLLGGDNKEEQANGQAPQTENVRTANNLKSDYAKPGPIFPIPEPFVVNLMGQSGKRYLKTSISLEMSVAELQKEVSTKLPLIKDTIIRVISSKTFEEISTPKGKEKLKEEITQEINTFMIDGYIRSVFFTEFVIQ